MAALDFPDTPTVGQLYGSSGTVWRWDGARWASTAGASGARGRVAYAQVTANQTTISTLVDLAGLTVTWTADPTRTYRLTGQILVSGSANGDAAQMMVLTSGGTQVSRFDSGPMTAATLPQTLTGSVVLSGLTGAVTYKLSMQRHGASTGTITLNAAATLPSFILVEDITYEAGTSGNVPSTILPYAGSTIPALQWFIAGGAGSSAGNPRAVALANHGTSFPAVFSTASNGFTTLVSGVYDIRLLLRSQGHWSIWAQVRVIRSGSTVNSLTVEDARGTWGNPPGVTGFDAGYSKMMQIAGLLDCAAGDFLQVVVYTGGGADTTGIVGDNTGYSKFQVIKIA